MTDRPSPPAEQEPCKCDRYPLLHWRGPNCPPAEQEARRREVASHQAAAVDELLAALSKAEQERDYYRDRVGVPGTIWQKRAEAAEARERDLREALERLIEAASQFAVTAVVGADELMDEDEDKLNIALNDARRALQATQEDA